MSSILRQASGHLLADFVDRLPRGGLLIALYDGHDSDVVAALGEAAEAVGVRFKSLSLRDMDGPEKWWCGPVDAVVVIYDGTTPAEDVIGPMAKALPLWAQHMSCRGWIGFWGWCPMSPGIPIMAPWKFPGTGRLWVPILCEGAFTVFECVGEFTGP